MTHKLSSMQTFTLMLVCLLGTSIIFGAPKTVPDNWLIELISVIPAILLFLMYVSIISLDARKGFYALLDLAWGRYLGKVMVLSYSVYFLYVAARNVRDMLELVMTALLRSTPPQLVVLLFVLLIAYAAYGGLKTLGRLSELILGLILLFFITLAIFLAISGSLVPERMLPFLSKGIAPIVKEIFTSTVWFPYGEVIVFLILIPGIGSPAKFRKLGITAFLTASILLSFSDLIQMWSLGMEFEKYSEFPLLDAARLINVADFISRMDALVAMIIIFSVLVKCAVFLFAGVKGVSFVFRSISQSYVYPLALFVGATSMMITHSFAEHSKEGLFYAVYMVHIPFQFVVPLLTGIVVWIRLKRRGTLRANNG
ncbi:GerAB/ArcD/ProY family transporter [Paenibacillus sp. SI8]|uniref:GerAB/ArcD/ProY family transporter n=1 Tax=unclassified Paenibacillus TaxID=185978 RepID=UPI0034674143